MAGDSLSDAESGVRDQPRCDVTKLRVTFGNGARTNADCRTTTVVQANTLPGHPSVRERKLVNASLDTTVPVMEAPLASSSSGVIDFPRREMGGAARSVAASRENEAPHEREAIGLEQVIADMATVMGGILKTMAEMQRVLAAQKSESGEPHRSRSSERGRNAKVDRFDGVGESWVDYRMHLEATARLNNWSDREKSLSHVATMKGGAQRVVQHLSDVERSYYKNIIRVLDQQYASDDQAEKHARYWLTVARNQMRVCRR